MTEQQIPRVTEENAVLGTKYRDDTAWLKVHLYPGLLAPSLTKEVMDEVSYERSCQDLERGEQDHELGDWMTILGEEYGESCRAVLKTIYAEIDESRTEEQKTDEHRSRLTDLSDELIQVAAVAIATVEAIYRRLDAGRTYCARSEGKV